MTSVPVHPAQKSREEPEPGLHFVKSRHFRLDRGFPRMSIQSRCSADYSLFAQYYSKDRRISQANPAECYGFLTKNGKPFPVLRQKSKKKVRQQNGGAAAQGHGNELVAPEC